MSESIEEIIIRTDTELIGAWQNESIYVFFDGMSGVEGTLHIGTPYSRDASGGHYQLLVNKGERYIRVILNKGTNKVILLEYMILKLKERHLTLESPESGPIVDLYKY